MDITHLLRRTFRLMSALFLLTSFLTSISIARDKPKAYVVPESSALNAMYTALGGDSWTDKTGWPVSSAEQPNEPKVYGISFATTETELTDRILVTCLVAYIGLSYNNLSGSMPTISFPELVKLDFEGNKLTGSIVPPQAPKLERLYLNVNKLTGSIPDLAYPQLVSLFLNDNKLSGSIPAMASCPNLQVIAVEKNNLTGSIPNFTQGSLVSISLYDNQLSGSIPDLVLPELLGLDVHNNMLSGPIPLLSGCVRLEVLNVADNQLTSALPAFTQNTLAMIEVSDNQLSGSLPPLNLPALQYLWANRNTISGALPALTCPQLTSLRFENNQLEGAMPVYSFPLLSDIYLTGNKLSGVFGSINAPELRSIYIAANRFDSLLNIKSRFPKVQTFDCAGNKLTFGHLLPNVGISKFTYGYQALVPMYQDMVNGKTRFSVQVGGAGNVYQWFRDEVEIPGETKTELLLTDPGSNIYKCRITNSALPNLTLWTEPPAQTRDCLEVGPQGSPWVHICTEAGKWSTVANTSKKQVTGTVTLNDLLEFQGSIAVDTAYYKITCSGEFRMKDVPLPGGGTADFLVAKGNFVDLPVLDSAKIVNFFNQDHEDGMSIFGCTAKLKELRIGGGLSPDGIIASISIAFPGFTGACGISSKKSELELKGIYIGSKGIKMQGAELKNVGLYFPGWCLDKATISYDPDNNIIRGGADISMPIGKVGGGLSISKGSVDSLAWRLESKHPPPFVLGTSTVGISGFFGHVSGLTGKELEVELGGIFSDITSESIYNVDVAGMFKRPAFLQGRAEARVLKTPGEDFWQIVGDASLSYDFELLLMKLTGQLKLATPDGEKYYFTAGGQVKMSNKWSPPVFSGTLKGTLTLPKLSNTEFPFTWLSTLFTFPIIGDCDLEFSRGKFTFLAGTAKFGKHALQFMADLKKPVNNADFLTWKYQRSAPIFGILPQGSGQSALFASRSDRIQIASGTSLAVLELRGSASPEAGTLRDPTGAAHSQSSGDGSVVLSRSEDGSRAFWTLQQPMEGNWTLDRQNPASNDTLFSYLFAPSAPFAITVTQQQRTITVRWDTQGMRAEDSVYVQIDEDDMDGDGEVMAVASAYDGEATFQLSDQLPRCEYIVLASLETPSEIRTAYGSRVTNEKSTPLPPQNVRVSYDEARHEAIVSWTPMTEPSVLGYTIHLIDPADVDSIIADVYREESSVTVSIPIPEGHRIAMQSYDDQNLGSCLSAAVDVIVSVDAADPIPASPELYQNYPNPFNPLTTIRFTLPRMLRTRLIVTDLLGREIAVLADGELLGAGQHQRTWNAARFPSGVYLYRLETNGHTVVRRMLVLK
ncbi:MAG: T9SS type A sorting domain-containing protein [Bacteroidetes bacterium]|nr:T9SS type A sorting domain-containing protein [Bacteroidota bacterium]